MKPLRQLFSNYDPDPESLSFFDSVKDYTVGKSRTNPNRYEIRVFPDRLIPKKVLRKTEADICSAYEGKYTVSFTTKYPVELFDDSYLRDLIEDAAIKCLVPAGFFDSFEILKDSERSYSVSVGYGRNGLDFMQRIDSEKRLSELVMNEFGIAISFVVTGVADDVTVPDSEFIMQEREELEKSCLHSIDEYERMLASGPSEADDADLEPAGTQKLRHIRTVFDPDAVAVVEDGICSVGTHEFDVSNPQTVYGDPFRIDPVSISSIIAPSRNTVVVGSVSDCVCDTRNRRNWFYSFTLFDGNASIEVRENGLTEEDARERIRLFEEGKAYAVLGDVRSDLSKEEFQLLPKAASRIKAIPRADRSPEKRVELHLHTAMSQVDAMTQPADVIKTAMRWGYSSIAVTDHGNVQAFPEIMQFLDKFYKDSDVPEE
ncbi:MAG: PHP domain-containing protein, partial [Clostridia bacterium]|nr:PHP domain-containing protein [Clostridia bacterium]